MKKYNLLALLVVLFSLFSLKVQAGVGSSWQAYVVPLINSGCTAALYGRDGYRWNDSNTFNPIIDDVKQLSFNFDHPDTFGTTFRIASVTYQLVSKNSTYIVLKKDSKILISAATPRSLTFCQLPNDSKLQQAIIATLELNIRLRTMGF